jgi:hypothetical protein
MTIRNFTLGALAAAALVQAGCGRPDGLHQATPVTVSPGFTPVVGQASAPGGHRIVGARLAPAQASRSTQVHHQGGL